MATEPLRALALILPAILAATASPIRAQAPLFLVNGETTVGSLEFQVEGEAPFSDSRLRERMATRAHGTLAGLRSALSWIPFVSRPEPIRFDPVALQRDRVRLHRFYQRNGFPRAEVDYSVQLDTAENRVDVVMEIESGPPRLLESVRVTGPPPPDTAILELGELLEELNRDRDTRLGEMEIQAMEDRTLTWASQRGFPFPRVESRLEEEDDPLRPALVLELDPGPLATVDEITLGEGSRLDRRTVDRQLLFQPGDTFSSRRLNESTQQLLDLNLVQVALVELAPDQPRDSTASVRIRLTEGSPRVISGRLGYADNRGILTELNWEHRDFTGGARTLRTSALAETGWWALGELARERYGASVSLEQPYLGDPRISGIADVFTDYRIDPRETSRSVGMDLTAIYERGAQRFISLRYGVSLRDVLESRGGAGTTALGVLEFLRRLEGVEGTTRRTSLSLSGAWGDRDDLIRPSRGWSVSGSVEGAGPDPWSDVQYIRSDLSATFLHSVDSAGPRILARIRGGRLFPLGRSSPDDDALRQYLRLGDAVFTEGGTQRVRGWEDGALGPKVPDLELRESGDSLIAVPTGRYVPLGGLARLGGSVEGQLPLPFVSGRHFALVFVDGARVWTPDPGFLGPEGIPALGSDDTPRFGAGAGVSLSSPVGPIRIMVGYKLNPSPLDLRNPEGVAQALLNGTDFREVPENPWRRWHLHLAIGQVF